MRKRGFILAAGAILLLLAATAYATSTIYGEFQVKYPSSATSSFGCAICHNGNPGIATLYNYGAALSANGINTGNPSQSAFNAAATAIEPSDSDSDGYSNIVEINAGTNPSDPASHPTPTPTPTPTPATTMPCPTGEQAFFYSPVGTPVISSNPAEAEPLAVVVEPGEDVDFLMNASFDCPVDATFSFFAPGIDPVNIFFIDSQINGKWLSQAVADELTSQQCSLFGTSEDARRKAYENLVFFNTDVTQLDVAPETLHATFPPGVYVVTLSVTPHGTKGQTLYRWSTFFAVQ